MSLFVPISRIEETYDNPRLRVLMQGSYKKVGIILVNHFRFVPLPKFRFPLLPIRTAPLPP